MRSVAHASPRADQRVSDIRIERATSDDALDHIRDLMRDYLAWQLARDGDDRRLLGQYFDTAAYIGGLATLPGEFGEPSGRLLIAYADDIPAGCVAMRDLGDGYCEMKRLFVRESAQACGIGRSLAETIIGEAKIAGYRAMRLDTSAGQASAINLYEKLGFTRVAPYYEMTTELAQWLVFFELALLQP